MGDPLTIDGDFVYSGNGNLIMTPNARLEGGSCSFCGRRCGDRLPTHRCGEAKFAGTAEQAASDCNFAVPMFGMPEARHG